MSFHSPTHAQALFVGSRNLAHILQLPATQQDKNPQLNSAGDGNRQLEEDASYMDMPRAHPMFTKPGRCTHQLLQALSNHLPTCVSNGYP